MASNEEFEVALQQLDTSRVRHTDGLPAPTCDPDSRIPTGRIGGVLLCGAV